ncbi:hypothetical protein FJTKL_14205 [Diaporthe vaccinii]|uniref:MARVEL domain-containing protein n=1 Tax=Diaporthe vaccinii TaxID=105482 RepID=A0ABR4E8N4_9PEZI
MPVYSGQVAMLPNNQLRMHSSAQPIVLPHGQPVGTPNIRPGESRRRICGGLVQHPYDWRFRTGATISQAVAIFICVMLMASLVFHWAIDKDALFNSALMIVSWTATVVLLWNFFSSIMQERYDFFTRSKQESEMYRARQRLFVWELAYALFSTGILAGWTVLLVRAQCSDSRRPGCTIGIAADAMLCGFAFAQWVFVLFEGHYVYKLNHEENTMLDVVQPRHGGQPVQRTVSNTHDRGHNQPKKDPRDAYSHARTTKMQYPPRGGVPRGPVPLDSYGPQIPHLPPQVDPYGPQTAVNRSQNPTSTHSTYAPAHGQQMPHRR